MTESEAIEELRTPICLGKMCVQNRERKREIQGYEMAIQALEKQIPKKPNKAIDSSWGIKKEVCVCPVCDYYLTQVHFIAPQKIESNKEITYCETCGQAIDWSDENDD